MTRGHGISVILMPCQANGCDADAEVHVEAPDPAVGIMGAQWYVAEPCELCGWTPTDGQIARHLAELLQDQRDNEAERRWEDKEDR